MGCGYKEESFLYGDDCGCCVCVMLDFLFCLVYFVFL